MNREERERTKAGWRRPRLSSDKGWTRITSANMHLIRQGMPARYYAAEPEPIEGMGGFINHQIDSSGVSWSNDGVRSQWALHISDLDSHYRLDVQL